MIPNNENEELNIVMKFKVDGFDYTIFAMTETMRCFGCNQEGHSVHNCPEKVQKEALRRVLTTQGRALQQRTWEEFQQMSFCR